MFLIWNMNLLYISFMHWGETNKSIVNTGENVSFTVYFFREKFWGKYSNLWLISAYQFFWTVWMNLFKTLIEQLICLICDTFPTLENVEI